MAPMAPRKPKAAKKKAPGRGAPRPSGLTKAVLERTQGALRNGHTLSRAAQLQGFSPRTFTKWRSWGQRDIEAGKPDTPHARWATMLEVARAEMIEGNLQILRAHAAKDWRAAAFLLERRVPEFHPKAAASVDEDPDEDALDEDLLAHLTDAELELLEKCRAKVEQLMGKARERAARD